MVVSKNKFICGVGNTNIHFCSICGTPYITLEEAVKCKRGHKDSSACAQGTEASTDTGELTGVNCKKVSTLAPDDS